MPGCDMWIDEKGGGAEARAHLPGVLLIAPIRNLSRAGECR